MISFENSGCEVLNGDGIRIGSIYKEDVGEPLIFDSGDAQIYTEDVVAILNKMREFESESE